MIGQQLVFKPPQVVHIEVGRRSAWLWGKGVAKALQATGTPQMRCPVQRTLTVPADQLADLIAYFEHGRTRRVVELVEVDR